jgi:hypothetical protein
MKNFNKVHLLEVHVNPIHRDLFMIITIAMVVAVTFISVGMMVISQF